MKTLFINKIKYINKIIRYFFSLAAFCLSFFYISAQTFTTTVSSNKIGKNQYAEVTYEISEGNRIENFQAPHYKDWLIFSGPNNSSYTANINGKVSRRTSFSYYLQPQKTGKLIIEGAKVVVDGKPMNSNSVTVEVMNKTVKDEQKQQQNNNINDPFNSFFNDPFSPPVSNQNQLEIQEQQAQENEFATAQILKTGEDANKKISDNVLLKITTNKNSCYEGEPIVATYKIYTRLDLINPDFIKRPSFSGFSAFDIEEPDQNYNIEELNGKKYRTSTFRKVQLYPLQSGNLTLDPVELAFNVKLIKDGNNFIQKSYILKSETVNINVLPLPTADKPADFKGAIGDFTISASTNTTEIGKGDATILCVKIAGSGNFSMVHAPTVQWPKGAEAYEPEEKENLVKSAVPINGDKTFNYVFLCHQAGSFIIPPIRFSYFDINTKAYKTIETKAIPITISPDSKKLKQPIDEKGVNWPMIFVTIAKYILPALAVGLILYLFLSFVIRKKKKRQLDEQKSMNNAWEKVTNEKKNNTKMVEEVQLQPREDPDKITTPIESLMKTPNHISFPQAEAALWASDHALFYRALKNDLLQVMSKAANTIADNKDLLLQILQQKQIDNNILKQINILFDECDAAIYAPLVHLFTTDRHQILEEAKYLAGRI